MIVSLRPNSSRGVAIGLVMLSLIAAGVLLFPVRPAAAAVTYTITVKTDKPSYSGNQTVVISGAVAPGPGPNTGTVITMKNPSGVQVDISEVAVNASTGAYTYSHVAGGTGDWISGNYNVTVVWGGSGTQISAKTAFAYSAQTVTTTTTTSTHTPAPTTSTVSCTSASLDIGVTTSCTETLSGFTAPVTSETITWSQTGGTGTVTFSGGGTCALSAGGACSIIVTGVNAGSATVKASYPGDGNNLASSRTASLTVNEATTTTTTTTTTSSNVPEFNSTSLLLVSLVTLSAVALLARNGFSFSSKKR